MAVKKKEMKAVLENFKKVKPKPAVEDEDPEIKLRRERKAKFLEKQNLRISKQIVEEIAKKSKLPEVVIFDEPIEWVPIEKIPVTPEERRKKRLKIKSDRVKAARKRVSGTSKLLGYILDLDIPEEEIGWPETYSMPQIRKMKERAAMMEKRPKKQLKLKWDQFGNGFTETFYRMRKAFDSLEEAKIIDQDLAHVLDSDVTFFNFWKETRGVYLFAERWLYYPDELEKESNIKVKQLGYLVVEARINTAKKRIKFFTKVLKVLESRFLKKFEHLGTQEDLKEFLHEMYLVNKKELPVYFPDKYIWWRDPERYWDLKYKLWWSGKWPEYVSPEFTKEFKQISDDLMVAFFPESNPIPEYIRSWKKLLQEQREAKDKEFARLRAEGREIPPLNASAKRWEEGYLRIEASELLAEQTKAAELAKNAAEDAVEKKNT